MSILNVIEVIGSVSWIILIFRSLIIYLYSTGNHQEKTEITLSDLYNRCSSTEYTKEIKDSTNKQITVVDRGIAMISDSMHKFLDTIRF